MLRELLTNIVSVCWKWYIMVCGCSLFPALPSLASCWWFEVIHDERVYTVEAGKCYKSGVTSPDQTLEIPISQMRKLRFGD